MDPQQRQTARTFDSYKETYSGTVNTAVSFTGLSVDFYTKVKAGYIVELVDKHFGLEQALDVLDVGCGIGNYHALLAPHFRRLSGVDVSSDCIAMARHRNAGVDYEVYDGERLPYADASFDVVYTICVMHHVSPSLWQNFVSEMRRVLRPGGLALVFEHNPRNPLTMRAVNNCPFDEDAVLLRRERTTGLLEEAGFSDIESRFILSIPASNTFLRRIDRLLGHMPFGAQYYVVAKA
ncbi:class I SAM-dependent methyltransferase [Pseudomonas tohonis]|nr:hypothetical protein L682_16185 [Pseudomonas alcaligenes OT 69]MDN4147819.1 class I SAM-dependent methyltransferase [Pseudomonas tohonis]